MDTNQGLPKLSMVLRVMVLAVAILVVGTVTVLGLSSAIVYNHGVVVGSSSIGVYADEACSIPISDVDWGNLTVNSASDNLDLFVRNEGSGTITITMDEPVISDSEVFFVGDPDPVREEVGPMCVEKFRYSLVVASNAEPGEFSFILNFAF